MGAETGLARGTACGAGACSCCGNVVMRKRVLVFASSTAERQRVATDAHGADVTLCDTWQALVHQAHCISPDTVRGLVLELDSRRCSTSEIVHFISALPPSVPVVVRASAAPACLRTVATIAEARAAWWVSLERVESVDAVVAELVHVPEQRAAQLLIVARIACGLPMAVWDVVVLAVLLSHRRTSVRELAAMCGLADRTVEWRLANAGLPTARTILGWMTSLYCAWRIDTLGWSHKRAARAAGFGNVELCDASVQRHTGERLLRLCGAGGFEGLLDRVSAGLGLGSLPPAPADPGVVRSPHPGRPTPHRSIFRPRRADAAWWQSDTEIPYGTDHICDD